MRSAQSDWRQLIVQVAYHDVATLCVTVLCPLKWQKGIRPIIMWSLFSCDNVAGIFVTQSESFSPMISWHQHPCNYVFLTSTTNFPEYVSYSSLFNHTGVDIGGDLTFKFHKRHFFDWSWLTTECKRSNTHKKATIKPLKMFLAIHTCLITNDKYLVAFFGVWTGANLVIFGVCSAFNLKTRLSTNLNTLQRVAQTFAMQTRKMKTLLTDQNELK